MGNKKLNFILNLSRKNMRRPQKPYYFINQKTETLIIFSSPNDFNNIWNIITPGTMPLVIISANESNCNPKGLETLNNRAKKPSKKSKKIPKQTKHIPNIITLLNLFCGCVALVFAFQQEFLLAFYFVCLGIFFDFFDGLLYQIFI